MHWPYYEGRLKGERVYENFLSREVHEVDVMVTTPEEARRLLKPLLEETPLVEIEHGLALFESA